MTSWWRFTEEDPTRTEAYDVVWLLLLGAVRIALFARHLMLIPFHPAVVTESILYTTVNQELLRGDYLLPIIHGYGFPFYIYWFIGKVASFFREPITGSAYLNFSVDLLIIPLTYLLGRVLFHRGVGRVASLLVALSPIYLMFSTNVLMQSAVPDAAGFLLVFLALKRRHPLYLLPAGICFGLVNGGGRFSPFLLLGAFVCVLLLERSRRGKVRSLFLLWVGFLLSMLPLMIYTAHYPYFFLSMFTAFTGSGFEHVAMPRTFFADLPLKVVECLVPLLVFNPFCTLPLLHACAELFRTLVGRRRRLSWEEKYLWIYVGVLTLSLCFLVTNRESLDLLAFRVPVPLRPIRYFFIFTPLTELLGAHYACAYFAGRKRTTAPARGGRWREAAPHLVLGLLILAVLVLPSSRKRNTLFHEAGLERDATFLTNVVPLDIAPYYRSHDYRSSYPDYVEAFTRTALLYPVTAWEFYAVQGYLGPAHLVYAFHGARVDLYKWYLNMPVFSLNRMRAIGTPTGDVANLYLLYYSKEKLLRVNRRYEEREFASTFQRQRDDWEAMRAANPDVDWSGLTVYDRGDEILLHLEPEEMAYTSLRLRFDRREAPRGEADFVITSSFAYLDLLGLGWQTCINLADPGDYRAHLVKGPFDRGVFVHPLLENHFEIRTVPGRYRLRLAWRPARDTPEIPPEIADGRVLSRDDRVVEGGSRSTLWHLELGDRLTLRIPEGASLFLYELELTPQQDTE